MTYPSEFRAEVDRRNRRNAIRQQEALSKFYIAGGLLVFLGGFALVVLVLYLEMTRGG